MTSGFSVFANSTCSCLVPSPALLGTRTDDGIRPRWFISNHDVIPKRSEDLACSIVGPRQILRPFGPRMTSGREIESLSHILKRFASRTAQRLSLRGFSFLFESLS